MVFSFCKINYFNSFSKLRLTFNIGLVSGVSLHLFLLKYSRHNVTVLLFMRNSRFYEVTFISRFFNGCRVTCLNQSERSVFILKPKLHGPCVLFRACVLEVAGDAHSALPLARPPLRFLDVMQYAGPAEGHFGFHFFRS